MQSKTGELIYKKVDKGNLQTALAIQHRIWPTEDVDKDYTEKVLYPEDPSNVSWLVYRDGVLVGLTGVFTFDPEEPGYDRGESIWMDWFAILPEFRRQHLGQQVLLDTIDYARQLRKYKYFRLDTTYFPNRPALLLYDRIMPLREAYTAEDTPDHKHDFLIYSCSLDGSPVKPWNNQYCAIGHSAEGSIII